MFRRDPQDRRYRERLAGSYLASLAMHVVCAALMISVVVNASQSGASESAVGGQIVTIEQRAPKIARATIPVRSSFPAPRAARIAPVAHGPLAQPAHQLQAPARPELAKIVPSAPPNPTPLPQATAQPTVAPTAATYETKPDVALPAVPTAVPAQVVAVTLKLPPTAAPTAPSSAAPTASPLTPKPAAPKAQPTAAPTAAATATARASAPPASAAPTAAASLPPAGRPGSPSPNPTQGPALQKRSGSAPSPGPSGHSSPGPRPGTAPSAKPGAPRPINVPPTPRPPQNSRPAADVNDRLRAMLPNNPVNPSQRTYRQSISLGGKLEPTPPPEVVALTKFLFEERRTGNESRIKMWVTNVRRVGPATYCDGWLLRYPENPPGGFSHVFPTHVNDANGAQIGGLPGGELPPIVESSASTLCSERALVPFAVSPAPSP